MANKKLAVIFEGPVAPTLGKGGTKAHFWRDTSGAVAVLKVQNKAHTAWVGIDIAAADVSALATKLTALDAAATALSALPTDLATTLVAADVDTPAEVAILINAMHTRINAVATEVNSLVTALKAVG